MQRRGKGKGTGQGMRPVLKEVTENVADEKAATESPKGETKSGATSGTDDGLGDEDAVVMMEVLTDLNARQLRALRLKYRDRLEKPADRLTNRVREALLQHWNVDRRPPTVCRFESNDGLVIKLLKAMLKTGDVPLGLNDKVKKVLKGTKGDKGDDRLELFWRILCKLNGGDETKAVEMCVQMRIQHVHSEEVEKVFKKVFLEYGTVELQSLRNDLCHIAIEEGVPPTMFLDDAMLKEVVKNFTICDVPTNENEQKLIEEAKNAGLPNLVWELYTLHATHSADAGNVANDERSQGEGEEPVIDTTLFDDVPSFAQVCKPGWNFEHREDAAWTKDKRLVQRLLMNCTPAHFDQFFPFVLDKIPLDATLAIFGQNATQYEYSKMTPDELARHGKRLKAEDFLYGRDLEAGRHGATFLALHKISKTPVVVKVLDKDSAYHNIHISPDMTFTYFVCNEIRLHGRLRHPNIIRMLGWFYDDTNIYIVMEYASQGDIREKVGEGNRMEDKHQVARIVREANSALKCIHQDHSIIHGDVKLNNILMDHTGAIKLADFGVSVMGSHKKSEYANTFAGTPYYMAPEMNVSRLRRSFRTLTRSPGGKFASDVWGLGMAMGELLYGVGCFCHDDITWKDSDGSDGANELLFKMLEKVPGHRIASTAIEKDKWIKSGGED